MEANRHAGCDVDGAGYPPTVHDLAPGLRDAAAGRTGRRDGDGALGAAWAEPEATGPGARDRGRRRMTPYACITGRFQPVHAQHLELIGMALARADRVVMAVTNPDTSARREEATSHHRHTSEANPFSYFERVLLLRAALQGAGWDDRVVIVPFDLTRPPCWPEYVPLNALQVVRVFSEWEREKARQLREAGYQVWEVAGDPATKVHATHIRDAMAIGGDWVPLVPAATVPLLRDMLASRMESTAL